MHTYTHIYDYNFHWNFMVAVLAVLICVVLVMQAFSMGRESGRQIEHAYRQREMREQNAALCWWDEKAQCIKASFADGTSAADMEKFAGYFRGWNGGGLSLDDITRPLTPTDEKDYPL